MASPSPPRKGIKRKSRDDADAEPVAKMTRVVHQECCVCYRRGEIAMHPCTQCNSTLCFPCLSKAYGLRGHVTAETTVNDNIFMMSMSYDMLPCPVCRNEGFMHHHGAAVSEQVRTTERVVCPWPGCDFKTNRLVRAIQHAQHCDKWVMPCMLCSTPITMETTLCTFISSSQQRTPHDHQVRAGLVRHLKAECRGFECKRCQHDGLAFSEYVQHHSLHAQLRRSYDSIRALERNPLWRRIWGGHQVQCPTPEQVVLSRVALVEEHGDVHDLQMDG